MFESYAVKKLQAQINRFPPGDFFKDSTPLRVDGIVDQHTAFRALILAEAAYKAAGDLASAKIVADIQSKTPAIAAVQADPNKLALIIQVLADAQRRPPAVFVFPTQQVMLFGGIGLGLGLLLWMVSGGKRTELSLPPADYDDDLEDDDVIDAEYEEVD